MRDVLNLAAMIYVREIADMRPNTALSRWIEMLGHTNRRSEETNMKGNNKLVLNYATVMEALQEYFDVRTTPKARFTVTSIEPTGDRYDKAITVQTENVEPIKVPMTGQCEQAP